MIDTLKLAISENDIIKAREILKNELLEKNYPHEIFKDAVDLALDYNVFVEHDKEELSDDAAKWTYDYLEKLKEGLNSNFSKERFLKAYYVHKKLNNSAIENECTSLITINRKYKDFVFIAKSAAIATGAVVIGAATIAAGLYFLKRDRKNN